MKHLPTLPLALLLSVTTLFTVGCSDASKTLPYTVKISEEGIGRIKGDTPFDASHIAALMPGFKVTRYTSFIEGIGYPAIHISRGGNAVLTLTPASDGTRIADITVHTPEVEAPGGVRVGDAFETLLKSTDTCRAGEGSNRGSTFCRAPDSRHIHYLFPTELLPYEKMRSFTLEAILWSADA